MTEEVPEKDADVKYLEDICEVLRQKFDTVQIFVTRTKDDGYTIVANEGSGTYLTRYGQVRKWLIAEDRDD
jgi:hypothetical protein